MKLSSQYHHNKGIFWFRYTRTSTCMREGFMCTLEKRTKSPSVTIPSLEHILLRSQGMSVSQFQCRVAQQVVCNSNIVEQCTHIDQLLFSFDDDCILRIIALQPSLCLLRIGQRARSFLIEVLFYSIFKSQLWPANFS